MDFFISNAWAQAAADQGNPIMSFLPLILIFVVFYFLLIRPQSKRQKEHKKMVAELQQGDEILTNGGLFGVIKEVGDNFLLLELADGVQVKLQRQAVAATLPKGSGETL